MVYHSVNFYQEEEAMKFNDNPVMIVIGIVLVGLGIGSFMGYRFFPDNQNLTIAVFVLAAILLFLVLAGYVKENVGIIVTALWLLLMGVMAQFKLSFAYSDLLLSLLPIGYFFRAQHQIIAFIHVSKITKSRHTTATFTY